VAGECCAAKACDERKAPAWLPGASWVDHLLDRQGDRSGEHGVINWTVRYRYTQVDGKEAPTVELRYERSALITPCSPDLSRCLSSDDRTHERPGSQAGAFFSSHAFAAQLFAGHCLVPRLKTSEPSILRPASSPVRQVSFRMTLVAFAPRHRSRRPPTTRTPTRRMRR